MDMDSFFRKILPASGFKIIAAQVPGKEGLSHKVCPTVEIAAATAAQLDARGLTVYHACNSFNDWFEAGGKRRIRTQANVAACRAAYDDLDVSPDEPAKYASRNDALQHLKQFLAASGVPSPMVISSGRGLHLYWPLDRDVTPREWVALAMAKRRATQCFGLKADRTVDMDPARVLRPVGTHWRKADPPRPVTLAHDAGPYDYAALLAAFDAYNERVGAPELAQRPAAAPSQLDEMRVEVDYPPSSLATAAQFCAQLANFRDTGCTDGEPQWYNCLGVAKHCTDGEELAHEWSALDARYDYHQAQEKLEQWPYGPATCAQFREKSPQFCAGCPHQVKSPIQLGYAEVCTPPVIALASAEDAPPVEFSPPCWPGNVHWDGQKLNMMMKDDTGSIAPVPFAHPKFWPTERVVLEDGTAALRIQAEIRPGYIREFDLPYKSIVDGKSLRVALGSYEVVVSNDKVAMAFLHAYSNNLKQHAEEVATYKQFGWHHDSKAFLIGDTLITAEGTRQVRLSENLVKEPALRNAYQVSGSVQDWVDGVDTLYNCENGEPYQYAIGTMFGSILVPVLGYNEWNGIPLALTSGDTALGKSSVCHIAINALYPSSASFISNATPKAILSRASLMKNQVVLFDEITKYLGNAEDLGYVLYALSNGKGRIILGTDGAERAPYPPWKLNSFITGNRNVIFQLTESKQNPEAMQMRVFEIDLSSYPTLLAFDSNSNAHNTHKALALHLMNNVHGVLAEPYITYVIKHYDAIQAKLDDVAMKVSKALGGRGAKERFYAYHIACTLVGMSIAQHLGFLRFDLARVKNWALAHVRRMRSDAEEYSMSVQEKFSAMLADLHGRILITRHFDTLNSRANKIELPLIPLRDSVAVRIALGDDTERGKCFIAVRAMDEWCKEQGVNPQQYKRDLLDARILRALGDKGARKDRMIVLGKGVPTVPTSYVRCLEFEYAAVQGYLDEFVGEGNVVPMPTPMPTPMREVPEGPAAEEAPSQ